MITRFYVAPVIGTGKGGDAFRPKLSGVSYSATIPTYDEKDIQCGCPKFDWCLAEVTAEESDHDKLMADPEIVPLPLKDELVDKRLQEHVASKTLDIDLSAPAVDVALSIGKSLEPAFDLKGNSNSWPF